MDIFFKPIKQFIIFWEEKVYYIFFKLLSEFIIFLEKKSDFEKSGRIGFWTFINVQYGKSEKGFGKKLLLP